MCGIVGVTAYCVNRKETLSKTPVQIPLRIGDVKVTYPTRLGRRKLSITSVRQGKVSNTKARSCHPRLTCCSEKEQHDFENRQDC